MSSRVNVLEVENLQLQERTLKLSNQVSSLERALRNAQSICSLEVTLYSARFHGVDRGRASQTFTGTL